MKQKILKIVGFISAFLSLPLLYFKLKRNKTQVFFFFPSWELGGAERVHLEILKCVQDTNPTCFITFKINNNGFKTEFHRLSYIIKLGFWGGHLRKLSIPIIARHINQQENPVVFGSNSRYYHDLIPYLRSDIKVIDLDHSFNKASNNIQESIQYYSRKVINRINTRIVLGEKGKTDNLNFYCNNLKINVPESKFLVIPNAVDVPNRILDFSNKKNQVLFVGRAVWLKRPNIFMNIAKTLKKQYITPPTIKIYMYWKFFGRIYKESPRSGIYRRNI